MVLFEDIKVGTFLHWFNENKEFYGIFSNYSPACRKCSFFITYEVNTEQLDRSVLIYIPENMMSDVSIVDKEHRFKFINMLKKSGLYNGFIERLRISSYIYKNDELIYANAKDEYGSGDWIINDLGTVCYRLDEFRSNYLQRDLETSYRVVYDIDGQQHRLYTAMINKFFHLWSLIDAKPGDVLVHGDYVFVFKDFDSNTNNIKAKCCCNLYIGYPVVCKETEIPYTNQVCFPADASQRELLFDSLLIRGYEYNKITGSIRKIRRNK